MKIDILSLILLGVIYGCVTHYTGHKCIAFAAVFSLLYLKGAINMAAGHILRAILIKPFE